MGMSDEENVPEDPHVPPPRKAARKEVSSNTPLPNRTRGVSERTVSAKQQAISKYFIVSLFL